jgi:acyl-CoA thioester hydrolase
MNSANDKKTSPLKQRATYSQWANEKVRFSDTDMLGHVNNASLATYFESGRTECIRNTIAKYAEPGMVFVVAKLTINFLTEVHYPAKIDIGTGILSIGRTSFTVVQALFDGERCVASSEAVIVVIDSISRKPCAIPDWLRERLNGLIVFVAN